MGLWDHMKPAEKVVEPTRIDHQAGKLLVAWNDGGSSEISARAMRLGCPCAACIEEWSGRKLVDPAQVAEDIRIEKVESVGNYALSVTFSDGHSTGIYAWKTLMGLTSRA